MSRFVHHDVTRVVHLAYQGKCEHIVTWLSEHVGPELGQGGLFWRKGAEWTYEFEPFAPITSNKVSFSGQVSELVVAEFALTFT